jgi:hypothetical protein
MGSIADLFVFKSAKQRAREQKQYDRWAFPYGNEQKEKLTQMVKELLPKEDPKAALAVFLMGRQAYNGSFKDDPEDLAERTEEMKLSSLDHLLATQLFGRYKKFIPYYKALVLADAKVDETLNYPSVEELRRMAEELADK